jgi:hypothetical protein
VTEAGSGVARRGRPLAFWFVVVVGVMSLFADMTYEGARSVNGQFLGSLGASALIVSTVAGLGELASYGLRFLSGRWVDRRHAYWPIAIFLVPALVSLALLLVARRLNPHPRELEPASHDIAVRGFGTRYWIFAGAGALIAAGFADFSLMAYHLAKHHILAEASIPLLYALANGINAASSLGLGRAFDSWGPHVLSVAILLPLASAPLVFFGAAPVVLAGIALWSLGVTVQQSLFKAMLTTLISAQRRATGFGTFDGIWGVSSFAGSLLLGYLYDVSLIWLVAVSVSLQVLAVPAVWIVTSRHEPSFRAS